MSTRAQAGTGLRPAEALPPTLTPNAVASMAQPVSKLASLGGTVLAYAGLGVCLLGISQAQGQAREIVPGTHREDAYEVELKPPGPPVAPAVRPPAQPTAAQRPPEAPVSLPSNAVPETPDHLPTEPQAPPAMPANTATSIGNGLPTGFTGAPTGLHVAGSPVTQAPIQIELSQVTIRAQVQPTYPPLARLAKVQGTVVLLLTVDVQGVPTEVQVLSPVHPSLDLASVAAARMWRFEPARLNGSPVSAQFRLSFTYKLK